MKRFVADFETTTDENDCRVWGYGITEIGNLANFRCGNNIDDFMQFWEDTGGACKVYFCNLRFDGNFIINWLDSHNFKFVRDKKDAEARTYTSLITKDNVYYNIEVFFDRDKEKHLANKVIFYDSVKIINSSVENIARDFHLPIRKGSIDYKKKREVGHHLTVDEIEYIRNDTEIVAMALDEMFKLGIDKSTIGASAMNFYQKIQPAFAKRFPKLDVDVDDEVRRAYRGGFTCLNPLYKEKEIGNGLVLDCNSEYPFMMSSRLFPAGKPKIFYGEYKYDVRYPLYIISFSCSFELRDGKIPTVQIKDSPYYDPMEYLTTTNGDIVKLIMTNVDYELFRENYDVDDIRFTGGYKFKGFDNLFTDYVNYWNKLKIESKINGNFSLLEASKRMLNSIYGKFGVHSKNILKEPVRMDDGLVHFENFKKANRRISYTPVALFTTSYGRDYLIRTIMKIREWGFRKYGKDVWVYSDTDSMSILLNDESDIDEIKQIIDIHKYKLGSWKIESRYKRAKYLRGKTYIQEEEDGKLNVVIAGFPKNLAPLLNFENFKRGFTTKGLTLTQLVEMAKKNGATDEQIAKIDKNLKYKYVKGGVILEETSFTLK